MESVPDLAYRLAFENESIYHSCAQAVVKALYDIFDLDLKDVIKASYPLAGGLSDSAQGSCAALAGGMLVIGSVFGRPIEEMSKGRYSKAHQLSRKLLDEFKAEFGSPICGDVQKKLFGRSFDLLKQDDLKAFNEMGGHLDKCTHVCGTAAKLTAQILVKEGVPLRKATSKS